MTSFRLDARYDTTRLREVYEQTGTDREAASVLKCDRGTWAKYRKMLGWPAKRKGGLLWRKPTRTLGVEESDRRMAVHRMGRSITAKGAALRLGMTLNAYQAWMRQHDLANHHAKGAKVAYAEERKRLCVYREALTDSEAARRLSMAQPAFHKWRVRRGLPPKQRQGNYRPQKEATA